MLTKAIFLLVTLTLLLRAHNQIDYAEDNEDRPWQNVAPLQATVANEPDNADNRNKRCYDIEDDSRSLTVFHGGSFLANRQPENKAGQRRIPDLLKHLGRGGRI